MDITQRISTGNRAKEVLDNEAYQAAIQAIKDEVIEQWKQAPSRDEAGREKLWMMYKLAEKLEATLKSTLETGKLASLELNHQQTLLERVKSGMF